ncbi:MAG: hypothetical protein RL367_2261 [Pseudomonadota bacterium]
MHPFRGHARILTAALAGTAVEYYDFFIYGTAAALVFGPLFFPSESAAAQTMFSLMSFGIAFVARPIGAIAFGHFGDRLGRKSTLVVSLMTMGLSTLAIAFLPTYGTMSLYGMGWVAPALLCLMRFGQGFGLGGEWGGAALLTVENAPRGWDSRFVSIMQLGSPLGFLAANGMFLGLGLWLTKQEFLDWGWRIPFLASAVLVIFGLWVRLKIGETPAFRAALERQAPAKVPLAELLSGHWRAVLAGAGGVVTTFALFYLMTTFALSLATGQLHYPRETFLGLQMAVVPLYIGGIILAGIWADRTSPARLVGFGGVATTLVGLIFIPGLGTGSLGRAAATLGFAMLVQGLASGVLGGWLSRLFPVRVRYSGVSLAFNTGGIIGGGLTPLAAQWLSTHDSVTMIGLLLVAAGVLTFLGVTFSQPVTD